MLTPFQSRATRALAGTPFFGELGAEEMGCIRRTGLRSGQTLFEKGDASEHLYGVIGGRLKIFSNPVPGQEITLELAGPGELVGAVGIGVGAPRHASSAALAHTELATIHLRDLEGLIERRPQLGAALAHAAARTATRLAQRAEDVAFLSLEKRLEKVLDDLAGRLGERIERGMCLRLRQRDLASLLGVTRESVGRALASPGLAGRIELGRGRIVLLD